VVVGVELGVGPSLLSFSSLLGIGPEVAKFLVSLEGTANFPSELDPREAAELKAKVKMLICQGFQARN